MTFILFKLPSQKRGLRREGGVAIVDDVLPDGLVEAVDVRGWSLGCKHYILVYFNILTLQQELRTSD